MAINETDTLDDRGWGRKIAADIQAYQQQYPGRPVYLIGQSGGCAVSVFTAETLAGAGAPSVSGIVLLDASLGADYDLTAALGQTQKGIVNFYNLSDVALLEVGTQIFGNLDGSHGNSAGRTGFGVTYPKLYQVQVKQNMVSQFAQPHFADTSAAFTARYISPWIIDQTWPAYGFAGQ
jgi:pimeloyl-ACP methyl ester carboxylesterase